MGHQKNHVDKGSRKTQDDTHIYAYQSACDGIKTIHLLLQQDYGNVVANYIAWLCPNSIFRLLLEALLREVLPKQIEVWVIGKKAEEASQKFAVLEK